MKITGKISLVIYSLLFQRIVDFLLVICQNINQKNPPLVRIFYSSDTSSEACQMNRRRILLINLLNRHQRFDSDAFRLKRYGPFLEIPSPRWHEENNRLLLLFSVTDIQGPEIEQIVFEKIMLGHITNETQMWLPFVSWL